MQRRFADVADNDKHWNKILISLGRYGGQLAHVLEDREVRVVEGYYEALLDLFKQEHGNMPDPARGR